MDSSIPIPSPPPIIITVLEFDTKPRLVRISSFDKRFGVLNEGRIGSP